MSDKITVLTRVFYHDARSNQLDSFELVNKAADQSMVKLAQLLQKSSGGSVGKLGANEWKSLVVNRLTHAIGYGSALCFTTDLCRCSYDPSSDNIYTLDPNSENFHQSLDDVAQLLVEKLKPRSHRSPPTASLRSSVYSGHLPVTFKAFTLDQNSLDEALRGSGPQSQRKTHWTKLFSSKEGKKRAADAAKAAEATTKILDLVNSILDSITTITDMTS